MRHTIEEVLDLVDQDDNIISQINRSTIKKHADIIIRTVAVVVIDKSGNVLLQQRSVEKKDNPLMWNVFACTGHVSSGELPLDSAHRELKEELDIDISPKFYRKVFIDNSEEHRPSTFRYIYYIKDFHDHGITFDHREIQQINWVDPRLLLECIDRYKISERNLKVLGEIIDLLRLDAQ